MIIRYEVLGRATSVGASSAALVYFFSSVVADDNELGSSLGFLLGGGETSLGFFAVADTGLEDVGRSHWGDLLPRPRPWSQDQSLPQENVAFLPVPTGTSPSLWHRYVAKRILHNPLRAVELPTIFQPL